MIRIKTMKKIENVANHRRENIIVGTFAEPHPSTTFSWSNTIKQTENTVNTKLEMLLVVFVLNHPGTRLRWVELWLSVNLMSDIMHRNMSGLECDFYWYIPR